MRLGWFAKPTVDFVGYVTSAGIATSLFRSSYFKKGCWSFWLTGSIGEPIPVPEMSFPALRAMRLPLAAFAYTCACEIDDQPNQAINW